MPKYVSNPIKASFISRRPFLPCGPSSVFSSPSSTLVSGVYPSIDLSSEPSTRASDYFKDFLSFPLGGFFKSRYDCRQYHVLSLLRDRDSTFNHPTILASGVAECGDVHVHDLVGTHLHGLLRELYRMG